MSAIDLTILEQQFPEFRSEELYFIRLAGTYLQSIFWSAFDGNSSDSVINRRRRMKALVLTQIKDPKLKEALLNPQIRWHQSLDCFKSDFKKFLQGLPPEMVLNFEEKLRCNHAIFLRYPDFLTMFETLLQARSNLEHFVEKQKKGKTKTYKDSDVVNALSMLLPPHFLNIFLGRVTVWQGKLTTQQEREKIQSAKNEMRAVFMKITKERKENTKNLYAQERTRRNIKDKKTRHSYLDQNQKWYKAFQETSNQRKDDYRPFNFKVRYHFMGEQNFRAMYKCFDEAEGVNFKRDIEPFYDVTCKVNLLLHCFLERLPKNKDDKITTSDSLETIRLRIIRNTVAHNGLFWRVHEHDKITNKSQLLTTVDVFQCVFQAVLRECGKAEHDDLVHRLRQLFRKQKFSVVDNREDIGNQPCHVRKWSQKNREKYSKSYYEVDEREHIQKIVAKWMKALQRATA